MDRHLGVIYGLNTLGAAVGVLLAGLFLIERLGLSATVIVANVINLAVGCAALWLARTASARVNIRPTTSAESVIPTYLPRWLIRTVLLASGFTTLGYEILWLRALRYSVGNSTYALMTVLFIFLAGLGLGSLMLRRAANRRSADRDLGLCQCAIAVLAVGAMGLQTLLLGSPSLREHISIFSQKVVALPWWNMLLIDGGLAAATMLPATLFMGLSFPLASRLYMGDVRKLGRRVGGACLLANIGSIFGSILAAVILLPMAGTIGGTKLLAVVNLMVGLTLLFWIRRRANKWALPACGAVLVVALLVGVLPRSLPLYGEMLERPVRGRLAYNEEADLATVQVFEHPDLPDRKAMMIDGYKIGWSGAFAGTTHYRKQVLLAHLPMVLDTRIRHTLNIGLGSSMTLYTLSAYSQLETLDCVEINAAVVRASRLFQESSVLDDPRVNLFIDDAVHFLLQWDKEYDLIISDGKNHPFSSGNATLLCREFYDYASRRLSKHGLFVQWIPLQMLFSEFRINLRTLCAVFPHVEIFFTPPGSLFMVASEEPVYGRPGMSREQYMGSRAYQDLAPVFMDHPSAVLSSWTAGKEQLLRVLGDGPISTWDHLFLDFSSFTGSSLEWARARSDNLSLLLAAEALPRAGTGTLLDVRDSPQGRSRKLLRRAFLESFLLRFSSAAALADQAVKVHPEDRGARAVLELMREKARVSRPPGR